MVFQFDERKILFIMTRQVFYLFVPYIDFQAEHLKTEMNKMDSINTNFIDIFLP